jgi:hypothetical protein
MSKKDNLPRGVQLEFEDVDYWHKLDKIKKVYTLKDGTKLTEYEYMKKFMHEFYGNNFSRKDPDSNILQEEDVKKEARRNNNNTNRDALLVSRKMGALNVLLQIEQTEVGQAVEPWEETYKTGTTNEALKQLVLQSCEELEIDYTKSNIRVILRIYFRIKKFLKMVRKDKKNERP